MPNKDGTGSHGDGRRGFGFFGRGFKYGKGTGCGMGLGFGIGRGLGPCRTRFTDSVDAVNEKEELIAFSKQLSNRLDEVNTRIRELGGTK